MLNSRIKDKIYAFLSFLTIVLVIGSFAAAVNFLLETNEYIFSVNEKIVKEKTTLVDKAGFENIKEKLSLREVKNAVSSQTEKVSPVEEEIVLENSPDPSPEFEPSPVS
ncbi:hypothetical protein KKH63_00950, partial [Patescibacteria group bacterium]|nr:hypothetical protein [Patescibacteria group bacterium]